jgi:hypothetical protein
MAPASEADPELIGLPRIPGRRVAKFHLIAAALASDANVHVGHKGF